MTKPKLTPIRKVKEKLVSLLEKEADPDLVCKLAAAFCKCEAIEMKQAEGEFGSELADAIINE